MKTLYPNKFNKIEAEVATALITVLAFQFMTLFSGESYDLTDLVIALVAFIFGLKVSKVNFQGKLIELLIALIISTGFIHVISIGTYFIFNHGLLAPLYTRGDVGGCARILMNTNLTEVMSLCASIFLFVCFYTFKKKVSNS